MSPKVSANTQNSLLTLLLLGIVQFTAVRAVQEAGWLEHPGVLAWVSIAALLVGTAAARVRLPSGLVHFASLVVGIGALGFAGASTLAKGSQYDRLASLVQRILAWLEITREGGIGTDNLLFLLFLASLAWLIGYAGAYAAYRHHSGWLQIAGTGASLVVTVSYAENVGWYFFVFAPAAILLFVQLHASRRLQLWQRTGIEHSRSFHSRFLRQGLLAGLVIILGSTWAPSVASGEEFVAIWQTVDRPWMDLQGEFSRLFGPVNAGNAAGSSNYGPTLALQSAVSLSDQPVFEVRASEVRRLRGVVYDRYTGQGWLTQERKRVDVPANGVTLEAASDDKQRQELVQKIRVLRLKGDLLFGASLPKLVSIPVRADLETLPAGQGAVDSAGTQTDLGSIRAALGPYRGQEYSVTSAVSVASADELRRSGGDYSQRVFQRYTNLPPNLPRDVRALARSLTAQYDNPYDKALAIERYLRGLTYTLRPPSPPVGRDVVEFFLFETQEGYCDYFSSSMVVMLRSIGIPARMVAGYLPGTWDETLQAYLVRESDAHSWPEVYFAGYGWIEFEPTASAPAVIHPETPTELPGDAAAGGDPGADAAMLEDPGVDAATPDGGDAAANSQAADYGVLFSLFTALVAVAIAARVALFFWARNFSRLQPAEAAYAKMADVARWFGRAPRAHETPFEYAQSLARSVPRGANAIEAIAGAFVRRRFGDKEETTADRTALVEAWDTLRLKLPRGLVARLVKRLLSFRPVR